MTDKPEQENSGSGGKRKISRRRFLTYVALGAAGAGMATTAAYARWVEPFWVEYHDVHIPIPGLPLEFDGFTIAHVTDLHCGIPLRGEDVRPVLERVVARKPDMVAVTGDLVNKIHDSYDIALGELKYIAEKLPTYVIPGNHDYWEGIENFVIGVPKTGAVDLTNRHLVLKRGNAELVIAGIDDLWEGRPDLDAALKGIDRDAQSIILLLHNPDHFITVRGTGIDLVLAGHTHGGQVKPPFMKAPLVPLRNTKYARGFFREFGTSLYVSRGVGMLRQVRFNCRPEVAYIVLRSTNQ